MRIAYPLTYITTLGMLTVSAMAAENSLILQDVSGKVLIATKQGMVPAKNGQSFENGTRVFVGENAVAHVVSADGSCDVTLPTETVTVINVRKLCDVTITPTARDGSGGGRISSVAVGLGFSGAVAIIGGIAIADGNNKSEPMSTP